MTDELGSVSASATRVPAWKLRQLQQQRSSSANDELGGGRSNTSSRRRANANANNNNDNDELGGSGARSGRLDLDLSGVPRSIGANAKTNANDELGSTTVHSSATSGSGSRMPAWKLREQMKRRNAGMDNNDDGSLGSTTTAGSSGTSSHTSRTIRSVSRVPSTPDPSLPPAFRAAFSKQQERRGNKDNFLSLNSMHSRTTTNSCDNSDDTYGSLNTDSDDDSFDGEDSFASMGSDADEDDDAYRESRNQLARLEIERQQQSTDAKRGGVSRFKKKAVGVHGTPLGFIAE
eukprot:jgi/Psemu1/15826/gm1.15826_g